MMCPVNALEKCILCYYKNIPIYLIYIYFFVPDDVSSISGSGTESESEDDKPTNEHKVNTKDNNDGHMTDDDTDDVTRMLRRTPRVYVKNGEGELFSVYRAVVYGKKVRE